VVGGFCVILIVAWLSGSTGEICKEAQAGHEQCTRYNLAPYILIQIREGLHSIENIITALATVAIAWFTWTLWQSNEKMWEVTKIAADAADLNAKAAVAIELPIIHAEPDQFSWGRRHGGGPIIDSFGIARLVFSNLGRTKAFPLEVYFGFTVGDQLPETPIYAFSKAFSVDTILEADPLSKDLREFEFDVMPNLFDGLRTSSTRLWFYCNLVYLDFMQRRHEAGFCWERWQTPGAGGFRTDPTPAYNKKT
jgi:hypothetical protein